MCFREESSIIKGQQLKKIKTDVGLWIYTGFFDVLLEKRI